MPDFSAVRGFHTQVPIRSIRDCCASSSKNPVLKIRSRYLLIDAVNLDTIKDTCPIFSARQWQESERERRALIRSTLSFWSKNNPKPQEIPNNPICVLQQQQEAEFAFGDALDTGLRWYNPQDSNMFFLTRSGFIGTAHYIGRGDEVIVPLGASAPIIVRPCTDSPGTYYFIGECYVHGIMDGELIELLDSGKIEATTYVLV